MCLCFRLLGDKQKLLTVFGMSFLDFNVILVVLTEGFSPVHGSFVQNRVLPVIDNVRGLPHVGQRISF